MLTDGHEVVKPIVKYSFKLDLEEISLISSVEEDPSKVLSGVRELYCRGLNPKIIASLEYHPTNPEYISISKLQLTVDELEEIVYGQKRFQAREFSFPSRAMKETIDRGMAPMENTFSPYGC